MAIVLCSENKGADQLCSITLQLICTFVFAYAKKQVLSDMKRLNFGLFTGVNTL